jgi:hypothetical protein
MRPVCDVPLPHIGRALCCEEIQMRRQHYGVRMMINTFQHANPSFPLSFEEILELIFWAFFEQERLQNLDAALFGLPPQSHLCWSAVMNMDYTVILQKANQRGLLNRAIQVSIMEKREQCEKQRLDERNQQVKCILEGIIYAAIRSSKLVN